MPGSPRRTQSSPELSSLPTVVCSTDSTRTGSSHEGSHPTAVLPCLPCFARQCPRRSRWRHVHPAVRRDPFAAPASTHGRLGAPPGSFSGLGGRGSFMDSLIRTPPKTPGTPLGTSRALLRCPTLCSLGLARPAVCVPHPGTPGAGPGAPALCGARRLSPGQTGLAPVRPETVSANVVSYPWPVQLQVIPGESVHLGPVTPSWPRVAVLSSLFPRGLARSPRWTAAVLPRHPFPGDTPAVPHPCGV